MKRNDIVLVGDKHGHRLYGRINRVIDDTHYEVVCCGKYFSVYDESELELDNEYDGYVDYRGIHIRMPTLRKLKQMAAYYTPDIWKHKQKRDHRREKDAIYWKKWEERKGYAASCS